MTSPQEKAQDVAWFIEFISVKVKWSPTTLNFGTEKKFQWRWRKRGGSKTWSPGSPDITLFDLFLLESLIIVSNKSTTSSTSVGQFTCRNCGGGDRGCVLNYRPFGEFRRAKIVLSPVWCSRPTTGVPLANATINFVGLDLTVSDSYHAEVVEVEIGGVAIYRPFGEFRRTKSYCHLYGAQSQRQAYL
ncbi:hypothetical protein TNCV_332561 [Trichonephila clavipes]|nr:hypothetical protein TNCV_332561 [Trichonephila clavipes]